MGETTGISWCHATLNFWAGCTKVGPACDHCYAETWGHRFGIEWGVGVPRHRMMHTRSKALKLERLAVASGEPFYCFSNSLSDIFDKEVPIEWLAEAFADMRAAPHVTFLLLTKRGPNIVKRSRAAGGLPSNAAIGITVVTQEEADRDVAHLLSAKAILKPRLAFLSMEPLLGPVDLTNVCIGYQSDRLNALTGDKHAIAPGYPSYVSMNKVDWVIVGGESGANARITHPAWLRSIREQCAGAGVPFHHKQNGEWAPASALAHAPPPGTPESWPDPHTRMVRAGKKNTGRLLDGRLHDAMPRVP